MSFQEVPRFPDCISAGSRGGPSWLTDVVIVASGNEQRNQRWEDLRHRYDVSYGIHEYEDMQELIEFFIGARGRLNGFRFKDFADFKSSGGHAPVTPLDQFIGNGDDIETQFQLTKYYSYLLPGYVRKITKPVTDTVRVAVNGIEQVSGWSVDTTTGIITFDTAPANGLAVHAGYEFDVPCRFDADTLSMQLDQITSGATSIPVVEIRI